MSETSTVDQVARGMAAQLRQDVEAETGAAMIGADGDSNVQAELDALSTHIDEVAIAGRLLYATWAELDAVVGTTVGQSAEVPTTDAGTHTDPVVGGTVNNTGVFSWRTSPATGWKRIGDTDTVTAAASAAAAAASEAAAAASAASVAIAGEILLQRQTGILEQNYFVMLLRDDISFDTIVLSILDGDGTVDVLCNDGLSGTPIDTTQTLDAEDPQPLVVAITEDRLTGSTVCFSISNMTGTIRQLLCRIEGSPTS